MVEWVKGNQRKEGCKEINVYIYKTRRGLYLTAQRVTTYYYYESHGHKKFH